MAVSNRSELSAKMPLVIMGLCVLNIIFASALAGLVSTKLDYQSTSPYCYLNTSGQVCIFTYISAAEIIFFALALLIPLVWVSQRNKWQSPAPILGLYLSLALFTVFWSFVMALTITARGGQATDAGLPQQSARTAAIGLAWTSTAVTALICVAVFTDLIMQRKKKKAAEVASGPMSAIRNGDVSASLVSSEAAVYKAV